MAKKRRKNQQKINPFIYYLILVILPLAVYTQAVNFDFVWDDKELYLNQQQYPQNFELSDYLNFWIPAEGEMYVPVTYTFWTIGSILSGDTDSSKFSTESKLMDTPI